MTSKPTVDDLDALRKSGLPVNLVLDDDEPWDKPLETIDEILARMDNFTDGSPAA